MRWLLLASIAAIGCNNAPLVALEDGGGQMGQGLTGNNGPNGGEGGIGGQGGGQGGTGGAGVATPCGDGALDEGEECDDGNVAAGDGCGPRCLTECECLGACDVGELVVKDPVTASCYRSIGISGSCDAGKSFEQAQLECEAWGGNLATPSTGMEVDFLVAFGLLDATVTDYLVGGRSTTGVADFEWVDGEPFDYEPLMPPWAAGEPLEPSLTTCVEVYSDGSLNADICDSACGYICERDAADVSL
jgi:cysteine-rich repeat protein